ncbi:MAG: PRC-barrel domain-containing protein [Methylobacterium frigidaeris]
MTEQSESTVLARLRIAVAVAALAVASPAAWAQSPPGQSPAETAPKETAPKGQETRPPDATAPARPDEPAPPRADAPPAPAQPAPQAPAGSPPAAPNPPPAGTPAAPGSPPAAGAPAAPPVPPQGTPATVLDTQDYDGVLGKPVRSAAGEDMGRIIDIIVDKEGRPRAAIIDFGGFLGVGSRKIAVDWRALQFSADNKPGRGVLRLNRNQVRVSPEYKPGDPIVVLGPAGPSPDPDQATARDPKDK